MPSKVDLQLCSSRRQSHVMQLQSASHLFEGCKTRCYAAVAINVACIMLITIVMPVLAASPRSDISTKSVQL